jgi:PAS domain-containing protein
MTGAEDQLQLIIDTIPNLVIARPDGFCDLLNQRWLDYAGTTAEQAHGGGWAAAILKVLARSRFGRSPKFRKTQWWPW